MITVSDTTASILGRSFGYRISVQSIRGADVLADAIPVHAASEAVDTTSAVPEALTLTVPRLDRGTSWSPTTDDHPLAANGQRLVVRVGVGRGDETEWLQRGVYLITETHTDGDTVTVHADGLLYLLSEARLITPYAPSGTMSTALRGLTEPALTCLISSSLDDRAVPAGINVDNDRLGAVNAIVDAWAATAVVDPQGFLQVDPAADPGAAVLDLTDATAGTVIAAAGAADREGVYNTVVATGTAPDGGQLQAVSYLTTGPAAYGGPWSPLPVPYFFKSELLTTSQQCQATADAIMARLARRSGQRYTVTCVPDPRVQGRETVSLTSEQLGLAGVLATVEGVSLPLLATSDMDAMTLTVVTV